MFYWREKYTKKIEKISVDGFDFSQIVPEVNYMNIFKKFNDIPTQAECRKKPYWICEKDCIIKIHFKSGLTFVYKIKAGFVTDFASIPSIARGFLNENDSRIIIAAIIHDINFGTKYNTFKKSNTLFRLMMKYYKMGFIKRNIAYDAVEYFGKSHFGGSVEKVREYRKSISFSSEFKGVE